MSIAALKSSMIRSGTGLRNNKRWFTSIIKTKRLFAARMFGLVFLLCLGFTTECQTISTISVLQPTACSGSEITVSFKLTNGIEGSDYFTSTTSFQAFLTKNSGGDFTEIGSSFQVEVPTHFEYGDETVVQQSITIPADIAGGNYQLTLVSLQPGFDGRETGIFSDEFTVSERTSITQQPQNTSQSVCVGGIASLSVDANGTDISYQWYRNISPSNNGGELITGATSPTYSPGTANPGSFYYYVVVKNSCSEITSNISGVITVNEIPAIFNTTDDAICGSGVASLAANASAGVVNWYSSATGGSSIATGNTYSPFVSLTTTYYIDATENGCTTATRTAVTATVKDIPTITSTTGDAICGSGTASLSATASAGNVKWYSSATGGASIATGNIYSPSVSLTTTYYIDATENGCTTATRTAVTATVKDIPTITSTTDDAICGSGVASLAANASAGVVTWYSSATGGSSIATGNTYSPSVNSTKTFYVAATDNGCTTATRTAVTATVKTIPTITSTADDAICGSGIASLAANASAGVVNWYSAATAGSPISTGTNYSPSVSSTKIFYVDATDNGCAAATRTAVTATVKTIPTIISTTDDAICGSGVASLSATASAGIVNWYSSATGGSPISTGNTYSPSVSSTKTFYVAATDNGCITATRTAVTATVKTIPTITSTNDDAICGSGTASLSATASAGIVNWYSSATGGSPISTGNTYSPSVSSTKTFYVDATNNGCTTATRTAVTATVKTIPTITSTNDDAICGSGVASLSATASAGILKWYPAETGGSSIATGSTYSPSITTTKTFYVDATDNGCTTATRTAITATVNPYPSAAGSITGTATVCPLTTGWTYSVPVIANADSYNWTVPAGWNITAGVGTRTITVTSGSAGNGIISVAGVNDCGQGVSKSYTVTVSPGTPSTPGIITGETAQCPALTSQSYSIAAVTNATDYNWTVPSGWTLLSGNGTTTITVKTGNAGQGGYIAVTAENSCGTSIARKLAVTVKPGTPGIPGAISGETTVCPTVGGFVYSITSVSNATDYNWTVPSGWTITSDNGTSITVTSGTSGKNGNISVSAVNSCGISLQRTLAVTVSVGKPATPGTISASSTCALAEATYSIATVPNADYYTWTVPAGWTIISGQNTNSIEVSTGAFGKNGNVGVSATNECGTSAVKSLYISVKNTPFATASPSTQNICNSNPINPISLSTSNGVSGTSYSWSRSNTGSAGVATLATSGTSATITGTAGNSTNSNQTTEYTITATLNGCSSTTTAAVTVYPDIFNNDLTTPTQQYNCDKDVQVIIKQALPALSGGSGIYTYAWEISNNGNSNWQIIPGETGATLNILQTDKNVFYRRIVTSGDCAVSVSDKVHVNLSAINVEEPANVTGGGSYCDGGSGVLVGIDASTTGAYYQLYSGSVKIGAALPGTGFPLNFGQITTAGTYTVLGYTINADGSFCSRNMVGSVKVIKDNKTTTSIAGVDQAICNATTATLSGNPPSTGTGRWSLVSGTATISSPTNRASAVTNLTEGDHVFEWTITNGTCTSSSQVTIRIDKPATTPVAGPSQNLCNASTATLSANTPLSGTGSWARQGGSGTISNSSDPSSAVTGLLPGDNIFKWSITKTGACPQPAASLVTIHVDAPATTSVAGTQQNICITSPSATLAANTPTKGTGSWSRLSGSGNISNPASPSSAVSSLATGDNVFKWTITNGTCSSSSDVIIHVDAAPTTSNAGSGKTLCDNVTTTTLSANNPSIGTGAWTRVGGTGTVTDDEKYNSTVSGLTPGNNIFQWTISNGVCAVSSSFVTISVNTPPSVVSQPSADTYICEGTGSATISASGAGTGATYLWQVSTNGGATYNYVSGSAYSGYNTPSLTINTPSASMSGNLYRVIINAKAGCASFVYSDASELIHRSVWKGTTNTDWNTASNWSDNQVPTTSCPTVSVPVVPTSFYPVLSPGPKASIVNLIINANAGVTIDGNTMQLSGSITNHGTLNAKNGSIELNGTAPQTISLATFKNNALGNLIVSNSSSTGVTLNGDVDIYRSLTFGTAAGRLNTAGRLTLKSTETETAWVGDMTGHTLVGEVTVERFLNSAKNGKKWLFLASPVRGETIRQAWMENGSSSANGYGIQITGPAGTAAGFDMKSAAPSMKTWNENNGTWEGIPTTYATLNNSKGYMVFVRGDRSVTDPFAKSNSATLRSKGSLIIGNVTQPVYSPTDKFISVANPYASAIDLTKLAAGSDIDFFTVWNPALGGQYGYGAYETYYYTNHTFKSFPWNKEYKYIQSGQAFFVQTSKTPGATLNFSESVKAGNSENSHFRSYNPTGKVSRLQTVLSAVASNGSRNVIDGTVQEFNEDFYNELDDLDGRKVMNSGENIAIKSEGKDLIVERRKPLSAADTIQYNLPGLKAQNYLLELTAEDFISADQDAFVEDTYLKTKTPLNDEGITEVPFTVTGAAGSSSAKRFRIVFGRVMAPLPVTFTSVKAVENNGDISVEWKVENEINVMQYEVEASLDGNHFSKAAEIAAINGPSNNYVWVDKNVPAGNHFYRIKSLDRDGKVAFTNIVKITISKTEGGIMVFPNPVTNGNINLQLNNEPAGDYGVRLLNPLGQVILSKVIHHAGGSQSMPVPWNYKQARGVYQLEVAMPGGEVKVIRVVY